MRFRWDSQVRFSLWLLVIGVSLTFCIAANAQSTIAAAGLSKPQSADTVSPLRGPSDRDSDSIISADDVLEVYVMDVAEISRQYRVSPSGNIVLPLLPNPLPAAGLTPSQFSDSLARQLRDRGLVMNPNIVVTIASSRLKAVSITGAVKMPQIYPVFGRTTLLEVLSQAQGVADDASNLAVISRGDIGMQATNAKQRTQTVDLKKLLQTGDPIYNIDIYPGDRITVPHAGVVYVVGAVNKPGGVVIRAPDNGMTVLQALAMAEDAKATAQRGKTMIIRPDPKAPDGHTMKPINLNLILAGKQPDYLLQATTFSSYLTVLPRRHSGAVLKPHCKP